MTRSKLDEIGRRIERLTLAPESISAPFTRLVRPLLYRIGWQPKSSVTAVSTLVDRLATRGATGVEASELIADLDRAVAELADNLRQVERATVINRRVLIAHAAWLRRLYELMVHAHHALSAPSQSREEELVASTDPVALLPPLAFGTARPLEEALGEVTDEAGDQLRPNPTRVLELQLDSIDHILAAAREEGSLLARRRRLLEAARQLLLETSAALPLDPNGVRRRLQSVAAQITRINRMEAVGLKSDVALLHQARAALSRGERDQLFCALSALRHCAGAEGDEEVSRITTTALDELTGSRLPPDAADHSRDRSSVEMFGDEVVKAIHGGYEAARHQGYVATGDEQFDEVMADVVLEYLQSGAERATLANALAVDGCFEVGGVLSPVRVEEEYVRQTVVPFPTQELTLVPAEEPADLPSAIISDPRTLLLDLAAGRLLTRRYVREEIETRTRTIMQGEVRVYVLDGSSSMIGVRARMRDAILIAELATLIRRLNDPWRKTRVTLFYRYFNRELGPVRRVESQASALEAIHHLLSTPRVGGTNIEDALLASLKQVQEARESDPDLARGQIVLITDGAADVSEERISAARSAIGNLPVGVSVIALGTENRALRRLVAHQRQRDERAFYHFMPDDYLQDLSSGRIDDGAAMHLPPIVDSEAGASQAGLETRLESLLQELVDLERRRKTEGLRDLERVDRELRIARPDDVELAGEGDRARLEALYADTRALARRFARWFPEPQPVAGDNRPPEEGTLERADLEAVVVLLATVAEVIETVGSSKLARKADAIEMLERLLPNAHLSPGRYDAILRLYPAIVAAGLEAIHGAVQSSFWWRMERPRLDPLAVPTPGR